ncbi:MAG: hypothetical protein ACE5LS_06085 [Thermoplasmata archaeon]
MVYQFLVQLPLSTFTVWIGIAIFQLIRGRTRTLTEIAFVLASISWAGYALADWLVFHSTNEVMALLMARVSVSFVTLAAFFLLLFSKLFLTKPHRTDVLLLIPFGVALYLVWNGLILGMEMVPWNWGAVFEPGLFLIWLLYVLVYAYVAIWFIYRTYRVVRDQSKFLGRRLYGIFASLMLTLALGLGTNTVFHSIGIGLMPIFSTLLVFPGVITLFVLAPPGRDRIGTVIGRWKSRLYNVVGAYLIYENGTLIASKIASETDQMDEDIFGATLDAIQTFMRTSFPLLIGKWLRRIEHGDVKILIERGRYSYIALVIQGEDPDTLWVKMREGMERFERSNALSLPDWNGLTDTLATVDETLEALFTEQAIFA